MTLTELSYYLRKFLPFFILSVIFFFILYFFFRLFFIYLQMNKPKEVIVPQVFGKIPSVKFNEATSSALFNYTLDTIEGYPVTTTDSAKVFYLPKPKTKLGYREKLSLMAKNFGFSPEENQYVLDGNIAIFQNETKKLMVDITNFNFSFEKKIDNLSLLSGGEFIPSENEIRNKAINFLQKVDRYPEEFTNAKTNILYLKYNSNFENYINVEKKEEANFVEIDFFRPEIDGVESVSPNFFRSKNFIIFQFKENDYQIVKSQINFFEKSNSQYDIFPLKTANLAWEKLQKGEGFVVAATYGQKNIRIKKIFLAYYDPNFYQPYLQPVYVFLGDNDFVAYLPAISDEWLVY